MFQLRHPARQLLIGRRQLCDPRLPRLAARDQLRDPHGLHCTPTSAISSSRDRPSRPGTNRSKQLSALRPAPTRRPRHGTRPRPWRSQTATSRPQPTPSAQGLNVYRAARRPSPVSVGNRKPLAFVIPGHGAHLPTAGCPNELDRYDAFPLERRSVQDPALLVCAEAMGHVPEDLRDLGGLTLLEERQLAGINHRLTSRDELVDGGDLREFRAVPDEFAPVDEKVVEPAVIR